MFESHCRDRLRTRPAASALLGAPSARVRLRVLGRVAWCTGGYSARSRGAPAGAQGLLRLGPADYRPAPLLRGRCSLVSGPIRERSDQAALGHEETIQDVSG